MPSILISNDDGIHAPGILALIEVAKDFGDLTIVAPNRAQSGMGHAISIGKPLRIYHESLPLGLTGHAVSGTPADCVKLATGVIMDHTPDLILSGINHGSNSSASSIYSGTLSAAREGAMQGIPGIGFSFCNYQHEADMSVPKMAVRKVLEQWVAHPMKAGSMLNVNVPDVNASELAGYRITRQAMGRWVEEFDERVDPYGRKYYWLTGNYALQDEGTDTDEHALAGGYVSITPMHHDLTAHKVLQEYQNWNLEKA